MSEPIFLRTLVWSTSAATAMPMTDEHLGASLNEQPKALVSSALRRPSLPICETIKAAATWKCGTGNRHVDPDRLWCSHGHSCGWLVDCTDCHQQFALNALMGCFPYIWLHFCPARKHSGYFVVITCSWSSNNGQINGQH
jgi:hypothetical protein